jgi:hypothetical protein
VTEPRCASLSTTLRSSRTSFASYGERGCVAQPTGDGELDVFCLSSMHHDTVELELDLYLQRWNARHPEAQAALAHEL